ncbi:hypothetical protein RQM47_17270 [Rubrivirga sp. S365]|uniref:hypothetical protein n=1 Tax=Rubrivirga sp. S365 TaxID=3076080 RepID=UPI0028CA366C|nr:hypothetical protein [Rubrivirga sp. S365]MDT7858404.1 hypothetical protein [Rubrivirga sp. S365]
MASSRKPRLSIEPATTEGTAFEGAFGTAPTEPESPTSKPKKTSRKKAAAGGAVGPAKPVQHPQAPASGDDGYERIVQGNWNVPAWMRAKVRAAAEEGGVSQNDVVQEALRRHLEETERGRGGGFALEARHFGTRRGGR